MMISDISTPSTLLSLLFCAALLAQGAIGCSAKPNGYVSMRGNSGGSLAQSSPGGESSSQAAGGASNVQTASPNGGAQDTLGGANSAPSSTVGGTTPTAGGSVATGGTLSNLSVTTAPGSGGSGTTVGTANTLGGSTAQSTTRTSPPGTGGRPGLACVIRVATTGSDSNDGSDWRQALATVQKGLDSASALSSTPACSTVEVWVAAGTYNPTHLFDSAKPRTATFQLVPNVRLYGGFVGTEPERSNRVTGDHVTILSGDIGTPNDTSDNSYHVVTGVTGAVLDGFTITGGNANGSGNDGTTNGGGLYNNGSSPLVTNCTFTNNHATQRGGGMYNESSSPVVTSCTFANNDALSGGGMDNHAASSPVVTDCKFANNSAASNGGGMYSESSAPTVTNSTFTNNDGIDGGGMYNQSSASELTDCTFAGNIAAHFGGGIYDNAAAPAVTNSTFAGNHASVDGGGMYDQGSSPVVTNCTFANNSADDTAGGMYEIDSSVSTVTNCILWGDSATNGGPEIADADSSSSPVVSYSIVQGGYASGTNIITADPLLVDAVNGDLYLSAGSPAIDAGYGCAPWVAFTDRYGRSRWDIASVPNTVNGLDIGAFEYQGTPGIDTMISNFGCNDGRVIETSVGVLNATCPGTLVTDAQIAAMRNAPQSDAGCIAVDMTFDSSPPNILLLIDTTESMALPVNGTSDRRWDVVERGMTKIGWFGAAGLSFFGTYVGVTDVPNCEANGYSQPAVPIDFYNDFARDIATRLIAMRDKLHSPATLYPALDGTLRYARGLNENHAYVSVVLVTDGRNQICNKTIADDCALVQSYAELDPATQVKTFVIGIAGDKASLDAIAKAGGTNRAYLVDGPGASEQFTESLLDIADTLRAWFADKQELLTASPGEPMYIMTRGANKGVGGTYLIPRVNSETDCDAKVGGWYYTTVADKSYATFCPCSRPNMGHGGDILTYWGCTLPL